MFKVLALSAVVLAAGYGAANAQTQPAPNARYVIVFSPRTERNTFLLDTQTGRTWQITTYSFLNGDPNAWVLVDRIDTDADEAKLVEKFGRKPVVPVITPPIPANR